RINHIRTTGAQTGVVFLAYKDQEDVQTIIANWKKDQPAVYDFSAEDGISHKLWVVNNPDTVQKITQLFQDKVPATYIADGHHRAASGAKVCKEMREQGRSITGEEPFNYFITCIFPE